MPVPTSIFSSQRQPRLPRITPLGNFQYKLNAQPYGLTIGFADLLQIFNQYFSAEEAQKSGVEFEPYLLFHLKKQHQIIICGIQESGLRNPESMSTLDSGVCRYRALSVNRCEYKLAIPFTCLKNCADEVFSDPESEQVLIRFMPPYVDIFKKN